MRPEDLGLRLDSAAELPQLTQALVAQTIKCIGFGYGTLFDRLRVGATIDLAVEPTINEYNGVELELKDVQFPGG